MVRASQHSNTVSLPLAMTPDAADELANLLAPTIEVAVSRAMARHHGSTVSPWLDMAGAAAHLGVSHHTMKRLSSTSPTIPVHRINSRVRFHRAALDEWVLSGAAAGLT